jgi:chromosome segregation ATPase
MISLRLVAACLTLLLAAPAFAQERPASKQERAELKFKELHERMQKLQVTLQTSEPEQSRVLQIGNRFVQESGVHERMTAVKKLLADERWDESLEQMLGIHKDLKRLMELLQSRDTDLRKLLEEIAQLEAFKKRVEALIAEQQGEKEAAAKTEALQKHLQELQKAAQQIEQLIERQSAVREETNQAGLQASAEQNQQLGQKEGELKTDTERVAEQLKALDEKQKELADPKSGDPKSGEPKAGDPKSGEPGAAAGCPSCASGAQSAANSMGQAQQKLQCAKPEASIEDMDQALRKLKESKQALEQMTEEAKRRLSELPFDEQARKQEKTQIDTDKLADEMENRKDADGEKKDTPGTENVQQAVPKQKSAAGSLKEYKPGPAKQKQQDAKDDLEEAKKKLEDALAQLRQQLQDEVLRSLEERFGAMLAKQKELSSRTKVTDRLKGEALTASGGLPAALQQRCQEIAEGERELRGEAADALRLLEEEGTTAVFPEMVAEVRDDLGRVAGRLGKHDPGTVTQKMQAEIEDALKLLIDALRRTIEDIDGKGGH